MKNVFLVVILVLLLGLGLQALRLGPAVGGTTNFDFLELSDGLLSTASSTISTLKIGQTGTAHTLALSTKTCTILADATIAATSTGAADCAITGVVAGDKIVGVSLATTSTAGAYAGVRIDGASASSTSGYVTFLLRNLTGAAVKPATLANWGSSTQVLILR